MLEVLQYHMPLSNEQQKMYKRLYRGYLGERKLAAFFKSELHQDRIEIYDLRLQINNNESQIDCLLILDGVFYLIEVKNFQGDYYYENQRWFIAATGKEINNPLYQLNRNELLLKEFFVQQKIPLQITPRVIFIHPEFHLYQAPRHAPIIYPNQLKRFTQKLSAFPKPIHSEHNKIANLLRAHHVTNSAYEQFPEYNYHDLKKGVFCYSCRGEMKKYDQRNLICSKCNQKEPIDISAIKSIEAFNLLFPNETITKNTIYIWCGGTLPKRTIQRILINHFQLINNGRSSYYKIKN